MNKRDFATCFFLSLVLGFTGGLIAYLLLSLTLTLYYT